jgi:hypothetical protein
MAVVAVADVEQQAAVGVAEQEREPALAVAYGEDRDGTGGDEFHAFSDAAFNAL